MSKELKIGLIATFLIALLIWGINFLKGKNILKDTQHFYALYQEIGGLEEASPVYLNGYEVGLVEKIRLTGHNMNQLLVRFTLRKNLKIPRNSKCIIFNADLMGTKAIKLHFTDQHKYYEPGDTIPSDLEASVTEQIYTEIQPIKSRAENVLSALDSVMMVFDQVTRKNIRQSVNDLNATSGNLRSSSESLHQMLAENNQKIREIIDNTASVTHNLKNNNEEISNTMQNLSSISDSLKKANLTQTIQHLENTLSSTDSLMAGIRSGKGSLGKMATDDSLYIHLNQTTHNLNALLKDMKQNPGRYINISVFGKNK